MSDKPKTNTFKIVTTDLTGMGMRAWLNGNEVKAITDVTIDIGVEKFTVVRLTFLADVEADIANMIGAGPGLNWEDYTDGAGWSL